MDEIINIVKTCEVTEERVSMKRSGIAEIKIVVAIFISFVTITSKSAIILSYSLTETNLEILI